MADRESDNYWLEKLATTGIGGGGSSLTDTQLRASALPVSSTTLATVAKQPALGTATTPSADVISVSTPALTRVSSTVNEASKVLKASAGKLHSLSGYNAKVSAQFIQIFNSATVPADATAPDLVFTVPASSNFSLDLGMPGLPMSTGISVSNSSTQATKTIGSADVYYTAVVA